MCCEAVHTRFRQARGDCGPRSSSPGHSVPVLPLISWLRDPVNLQEEVAFSQGYVCPPSAPQPPPMTSGSSSGTLGCPAMITSSRLGEAVDWAGGGKTAGVRCMAHDSQFSLHADSQLLTLNCGSVPLRLCPVATCPDDFLLAGCEGGCCCFDVRLDQPQKQR